MKLKKLIKNTNYIKFNKMINKLYIDDNIYLFDELDEEKKSYNIFIHITNYQITSKLLNFKNSNFFKKKLKILIHFIRYHF